MSRETRTRWGLFDNVVQFEKAWQKRLTALSRVQKSAKTLDETLQQIQNLLTKKAIVTCVKRFSGLGRRCLRPTIPFGLTLR